MTPWLRREYRPEDKGPLLYLLGVSYCRSRAGARAGASRSGGSREEFEGPPSGPNYDIVAQQRAFMEAHRPIWLWLLENADVELVVDPVEQDTIFGWMATSGPTVLHTVGCKRNFCEREPGELPVSVDLVTELLGERMQRHQVCTLETPQLRPRGSGSIGIERPRLWSLDPTWLLTRMVRP